MADAETPAAFPHVPPVPVPEPQPEAVVVPPLAEHADWREDDEHFRAPPEPTDDDALQHAPEAPQPLSDIDAEEREERRRQQEEAARAYEQARQEQAREEQAREEQ